MSTAYHKQVRVRYGDQSAKVDAGIAPLIGECWRAGIRTTASCEDFNLQGGVWLVFRTWRDARRFAALRVRSKPWPRVLREKIAKGDAVGATDHSYDYMVGRAVHQVLFPRAMYELVFARLLWHNAQADWQRERA